MSEINVGITDHKSTKVLAPPGGKDSISFGVSDLGENSAHVKACQVERNKSNIFVGGDLNLPHKGNAKSCQEARQRSQVFTAPNEPLPVKPSTAHGKNSGDIIRANSQDEPQRTSVRTHAPPGGASHIVLG
ncbi:uncharacterized protein LOC5506748 isoform X1 [Nematostella vectensis]|uniref:uncharacterized protein LOC5506748 isoform X1 n=1 Tax=Nematostella vectensis TaxID=45351 RepID=UPI0020776043|nr:uncharacterized protein LOC5506748 isoform X1 [Nematostella vectensis]